jgi:hypothetical protein
MRVVGGTLSFGHEKAGKLPVHHFLYILRLDYNDAQVHRWNLHVTSAIICISIRVEEIAILLFFFSPYPPGELNY